MGPTSRSLQALEGGRRNLSAHELGRLPSSLPGPQHAPRRFATSPRASPERALAPGARARRRTSSGSWGRRSPGKHQSDARFQERATSSRRVGGLRLLAVTGRRRAARRPTGRLRRCHCLTQPLSQPVTELAVSSVHHPRQAPCRAAAKPGYF